MASRKTYFGIGWPKDPTEPGAPSGSDAEDRSAPTVVDDEKVAEGLRQLRSWVQSEVPPENRPDNDPMRRTPTPPPGAQGARPTAVGHATGPPPAAPQRPMAPDPMRATMYGHDVHQFEFPPGAPEATPTAQPPQPSAPAAAPASTALVLADPGARQRDTFGQPVEAVPGAIGRPTQEPFPLAQQAVAQRLHRPGGVHRATPVSTPSVLSRVPMASRLVFGAGIAALGAALTVSLLSNSNADAPQPAAPSPTWTTLPIPSQPAAARSPAPPAPVVPTMTARPTAIPATAAPTARPTAPRAAAPAPSQASVAPPVGDPKERPAPLLLKTPRRPREPRPELPTEVGEASTTAAGLSPAEKETSEHKEADAKEPKEAPAARATREPKEARDGQGVKDVKDVKETKAAKDVKAPKEPKGRAADLDATLPPSMD
jgi:hypothetical protein